MGARRIRREQRQADMKESRHRNGILKAKERSRRLHRLKDALAKSAKPYSPTVLSWLAAELGKPARLVTETEIQALLQRK
jgi:truncated hemoglobin YjbI